MHFVHIKYFTITYFFFFVSMCISVCVCVCMFFSLFSLGLGRVRLGYLTDAGKRSRCYTRHALIVLRGNYTKVPCVSCGWCWWIRCKVHFTTFHYSQHIMRYNFQNYRLRKRCFRASTRTHTYLLGVPTTSFFFILDHRHGTGKQKKYKSSKHLDRKVFCHVALVSCFVVRQQKCTPNKHGWTWWT